MKASKRMIGTFSFTAALLFTAVGQAATHDLKPFVLAYKTNGTVDQVAKQVESKLKAGGFDVAGSYSPYAGAEIIVVTDPTLKKAAAQTQYGAYAAGQRVTVTKENGQIQVAYTNPEYMAYAYHLKSDLQPVAAHLKKVLGDQESYGAKSGMSPGDLKGYHYMFGMPYFSDMDKLATYPSYDAALKAVEQGLKEGKGGVTEVDQIAIPGRQETLFGVHMTKGCSGDKYIMSRIDFKTPRSTGHLPYGILVDGSKVYALAAKFRIAINFPDLGMMGSHSFFSIMCAPDAIKKALTAAAGGNANS
ncbi:MAG TPA: hypothetical protein VKA76_09885 [Gammaproteobacteria bacterium]|nr:hypothetical protein [Gammaproteobacteria bacterium]